MLQIFWDNHCPIQDRLNMLFNFTFFHQFNNNKPIVGGFLFFSRFSSVNAENIPWALQDLTAKTAHGQNLQLQLLPII